MSQKINPVGIRTGTFLPWKSRWFVDDSSYKDLLLEDIKIREELMEKLKLAGITGVEIERLPKNINFEMNIQETKDFYLMAFGQRSITQKYQCSLIT